MINVSAHEDHGETSIMENTEGLPAEDDTYIIGKYDNGYARKTIY